MDIQFQNSFCYLSISAKNDWLWGYQSSTNQLESFLYQLSFSVCNEWILYPVHCHKPDCITIYNNLRLPKFHESIWGICLSVEFYWVQMHCHKPDCITILQCSDDSNGFIWWTLLWMANFSFHCLGSTQIGQSSDQWLFWFKDDFRQFCFTIHPFLSKKDDN